MYPKQFDVCKKKFLKNPEVLKPLSKIREQFEEEFKRHVLDKLNEEKIEDGLETFYDCMRDDMEPEDYTIFDILLISKS